MTDEKSTSTSADGGLSLSDLVAKLHAPIPGANAFVFHGSDGTFIVNRDFEPPAKRLLREAQEDEKKA